MHLLLDHDRDEPGQDLVERAERHRVGIRIGLPADRVRAAFDEHRYWIR